MKIHQDLLGKVSVVNQRKEEHVLSRQVTVDKQCSDCKQHTHCHVFGLFHYHQETEKEREDVDQ